MEAPRIVTPPMAQVVGLQQSATFSVIATGPGPLRYQWYKADGSLGSLITGATSPEYVATPAAVNLHNAFFWVRVSNAAGIAESPRVAVTVGRTATTGSLATPRVGHTATLLPSGKVLIAGGYSPDLSILSSAELYDPASGTFSPGGTMKLARYQHTATLLLDGRVLLAGGAAGIFDSEAHVEIYDPAQGTFTEVGPKIPKRTAHTATRLQDGRVLLAGGWGDQGQTLDTGVIFDPMSSTFVAAGSMAVPRKMHTATLLTSGAVLLVGGTSGPGSSFLSGCELFDPDTGRFSPTGSLGVGRYDHRAELLPGGSVLVTGGKAAGLVPAGKAESFDASTRTFRFVTYPNVSLIGGASLSLPDGQVMLLGGQHSSSQLDISERYDPTIESFTRLNPLKTGRRDHTATRLADGRILLVGGTSASNDFLATAELYE